MSWAALITSSKLLAISDSITGSPTDKHNSLNNSLSSALSIVSALIPKSSTPHSSKIPFLANCIPKFRPV